MAFDPKTKIGDIVLEVPAAMRVFEELGVDYCCGGQRSLLEACGRAGVAAGTVLARLDHLQAPPAGRDPGAWKGQSLTALMAHIEATHHAFTRSELDRVAPLMARVLQVHGEHHPELARAARCLEALDADLKPHLEKEERILFPYIRALETGQGPAGCCFGTVQNPIRAMEAEHDQAGELLRELRELTGGYAPPQDACASYRSLLMGLRSLEEDLHLHIYLENHLLFPGAVELEAELS